MRCVDVRVLQVNNSTKQCNRLRQAMRTSVRSPKLAANADQRATSDADQRAAMRTSDADHECCNVEKLITDHRCGVGTAVVGTSDIRKSFRGSRSMQSDYLCAQSWMEQNRLRCLYGFMTWTVCVAWTVH